MSPMSKPKIAIIGGGIAGMACAYRLLEFKKAHGSDFEILLFEAGSKLGGIIETEKRNGFILEKGPDSFISEKPWGLDLSKRLGIDSEMIGTRNEFRKSFVARQNQLIPLPEGFYLIAPTNRKAFIGTPLFSVAGKIRIASEFFLPKKNVSGDESIGAFVRRRFGKEALERVGQPMLAGIYTGDPDELSLAATIPRFSELEQTYGSVLRGLLVKSKEKKELGKARGPRYSLFLSFRHGMQTLVDAITKEISRESVHLGSAVKNLSYQFENKQWIIQREDGIQFDADVICLALPAFQSARLLRDISPNLFRKLGDISYQSVLTINFGFQRDDLAHPLDGFGFVVPRTENRSLVACSFSSVKFENRAPGGHVLLRAFVGGAFGKNFFEMNDRDIEKLVLKDLSDFLGIKNQPMFSLVNRHSKSMVQYRVGHLDLVADIETEAQKINGLFLTGSAFRGIGISDCIRDAEIQAGKIFEKIKNEKSGLKQEDLTCRS